MGITILVDFSGFPKRCVERASNTVDVVPTNLFLHLEISCGLRDRFTFPAENGSCSFLVRGSEMGMYCTHAAGKRCTVGPDMRRQNKHRDGRINHHLNHHHLLLSHHSEGLLLVVAGKTFVHIDRIYTT